VLEERKEVTNTCGKVLLDRLIVAQLAKKFLAL
jgi:hypothetical protein